MKYEVEHKNFTKPDPTNEYWMYWAESEIGMLTGLELDEILPLTGKATRYSGQWYVKVFRALGFNCNVRWIKFEKNTPYPCMMRTRKRGVKNYWYGFVYYDGFVYDIFQGKITWAEWNKIHPTHKVTSMLQVWLEIDQHLNERTDR